MFFQGAPSSETDRCLQGPGEAFLSRSRENPVKNIPFVSSKPQPFSPLCHLFHVCRPWSFFCPVPLLHSRALTGPAVPTSIVLIVYSLYPGTKDIKLSDLWAGAGAWVINEALGRGRRRDGWRVRKEARGRGRRTAGQVGWQTHNQWTNRWGLLLSSDKRPQAHPGRTSQIIIDRTYCFLCSWA